MRQVRVAITDGARVAWWWLRQVMGDAAYENYLRSAARHRGAQEAAKDCCEQTGREGRLLTREEFYLDALRRRYSGVSRCC
jgi:Selenoprotein, putative